MTLFHGVNPVRKPATDLIKKAKWKKLIDFELPKKFNF